MDDRTGMVPQHSGRNILPCSPFFTRLLRIATYGTNQTAIRDLRTGAVKSYLDLLSDALSLRERLLNQLSPHVLRALDAGDEVYICIFVPGCYEYAVAVLAVIALGAAAVPLAAVLPVEEAIYFVHKSKSPLVIVSNATRQRGNEVSQLLNQRHADTAQGKNFKSVPVEPCVGTNPLQVEDIYISSNRYLDDNAAGFVIFTSGTTGPPKGAVMRRAYLHDTALGVVKHFTMNAASVLLHVLPVHHATGVGLIFFPALMAGATLEFRSGSFDETWLWTRIRDAAVSRDQAMRLTHFSAVPTIYMRMMRFFQNTLSKQANSAEYVQGARQLTALMCGTSALPWPVDDFWTRLLGQKIIQRYGATEIGAVIKVRMGVGAVPHGSVGERVMGVDIKLSEGDEGEMLIKSPYMFSKYLFDAEATRNAHENDGYYKTGDIARREGRFYFILGRASQDIIKSGGYKISALDIEREILALPFVSEVTVVGVADAEYGQRVAAAITLRQEGMVQNFRETHGEGPHLLSIYALREDLKTRLAGYKLPTLLRVVEGELPKSATGKVGKKTLGPQYFPENYERHEEIQVWRHVKTKL
ncbi:acetyl-CoA synthetase-like protein [Pseudovirgaria hyperparasitica]|uniref:Acetyl-CoA synthetase-like protein n=1 Tax=Pseudovirgaria hyperparasitica TaxID=470096 RepID=A0A6A6VR80_9PEZI|nr:acetyl-CoA synthetase-like protein [Pseudovirgaria hyperparasitica]KAF2753178.1 acetyl-CoA synthetase-like protein [Pseudovirgaria hyperparasitica]